MKFTYNLSKSEYELIDFPLLDLKMTIFSSTEHLSAASTRTIVAVVETLGKVCTAI